MKATKSAKAFSNFAKLIENVNNLVHLNLLQVSENEPDFYLNQAVWVGRDKHYKLNFCKNLSTFWHLNNQTPMAELKNFTLAVFDKETAEVIATYHMKNGLKLMDNDG